MRRREPGFYVSVRTAGPAAPVLPAELLDGPWPTRASAERRRREILAQRDDRVTAIVQVAEDGVTILREVEG